MDENHDFRSEKPSYSGRSRKSPPFADHHDLLNDRYRLLRLLGQGGAGKTFLAVDEQQGMTSLCVIKQFLLPGGSVDYPKAWEFFHKKTQHLAELGEHPQIPSLLNIFIQGGQAFTVQQWINGSTLAEEARDSVPFDEIEVCQLLHDLLLVLKYLHDHQIIHCDIKPANIIRRSGVGKTFQNNDRQFVLVDLGSAIHFVSTRYLPNSDLIGSAEYTAPEQLQGHAVFASDLYSLGLVCLHLLTRMSPFDLYDLGEDEWRWQMYLVSPISPAFKQILCKLLQPLIRRRYQSASEVLADLNSLSLIGQNSSLGLERKNKRDFSLSSKENSDDSKPLPPLRRRSSTSIAATYADWAIHPISFSTNCLSTAQNKYYSPPETKTSGIAGKVALFLSSRLTSTTEPVQSSTQTLKRKSLSRKSSKSLKNDDLDLVFRVILYFNLMCLGFGALICGISRFDQQLSPPHPKIQQSLFSSPTQQAK